MWWRFTILFLETYYNFLPLECMMTSCSWHSWWPPVSGTHDHFLFPVLRRIKLVIFAPFLLQKLGFLFLRNVYSLHIVLCYIGCFCYCFVLFQVCTRHVHYSASNVAQQDYPLPDAVQDVGSDHGPDSMALSCTEMRKGFCHTMTSNRINIILYVVVLRFAFLEPLKQSLQNFTFYH